MGTTRRHVRSNTSHRAAPKAPAFRLRDGRAREQTQRASPRAKPDPRRLTESASSHAPESARANTAPSKDIWTEARARNAGAPSRDAAAQPYSGEYGHAARRASQRFLPANRKATVLDGSHAPAPTLTHRVRRAHAWRKAHEAQTKQRGTTNKRSHREKRKRRAAQPTTVQTYDHRAPKRMGAALPTRCKRAHECAAQRVTIRSSHVNFAAHDAPHSEERQANERRASVSGRCTQSSSPHTATLKAPRVATRTTHASRTRCSVKTKAGHALRKQLAKPPRAGKRRRRLTELLHATRAA
jgi:hypothetical protein